jgi:hypothetical protein
MKIIEYKQSAVKRHKDLLGSICILQIKYCAHLPKVIFPLMNFGSFLMSAMAAIGMPQFATGPQKWVLKDIAKTHRIRVYSIHF